jgi:hypothetical protein
MLSRTDSASDNGLINCVGMVPFLDMKGQCEANVTVALRSQTLTNLLACWCAF